MKIPHFFNATQNRINLILEQRLPKVNTLPKRLHKAMHYSVLNGGKRLRPMLVYAAGNALEMPLELLDDAACAIEFMHCYSLIHDDLPAMDDDDLRRGKPSAHKAFDVATAILAGDALQSLAFEVLAASEVYKDEQIVDMLKLLAQASGSLGMAGGQSLDLSNTKENTDIEKLKTTHKLKTGALICGALKLAIIASDNQERDKIDALGNYANCIGLAFQIQDDVLDITSSTTTLGKPQGADRAANKPCYPELLGLEQSQQAVKDLHQEAIKQLNSFGDNAEHLHKLADYIVSRNF